MQILLMNERKANSKTNSSELHFSKTKEPNTTESLIKFGHALALTSTYLDLPGKSNFLFHGQLVLDFIMEKFHFE